MQREELIKGKEYRFTHNIEEPEPMTYIGCNWSSNGYWHQFTRDGRVWSEIQDEQLKLIEPVQEEETTC